jgi:hypothetical protein
MKANTVYVLSCDPLVVAGGFSTLEHLSAVKAAFTFLYHNVGWLRPHRLPTYLGAKRKCGASDDRKSCSVEGKEKGGVSCCDLFTNSSPRRAERIRHHARFYGSRFELSIRSQASPTAGSTGSDRDVSG